MHASGSTRESPTRRRRFGLRYWHREALALVDEITATAERIAAARGRWGQLVRRSDLRWRLLCAVESDDGRLTISDLGRALGISRQAAHRLACAAEREREVELRTHPCDRRILQLALTPFGKQTLEDARAEEVMWVTALLYDLEPREMRRTTHILRVIRHRLLRNERERRAQKR